MIMGDFLLWADKKTSYETVASGIRNLVRQGEVKLLGVTGEERNDMVVNEKKLPWISCEEIQDLPYDYILYFGSKPFSEFGGIAKKLGIKTDKTIPSSAMMIPGFSVERYRKLRSSDISIISMNCFAGLTYHTFGLPFLTPTINMFWLPDHFIKFVSDLRYYMNLELRYYKDDYEENLKQNYPVFLLGDCEI